MGIDGVGNRGCGKSDVAKEWWEEGSLWREGEGCMEGVFKGGEGVGIAVV